MLTALFMACHTQILYPNVDSNHFTIPDAGDRTPGEMVQALIEEKCPEYTRPVLDTKCRNIDVGGRINGRVCVTYTTVGYFFTMWDIMENAHIVFSRWD